VRQLLLPLLLLFACAAASSDADFDSLVKSLRAAKIPVEREEEVEQPFFSVKAKVILLYGDPVQIFEYPSSARADAEATLVSSNGRTVGTAKPLWIAPPHFYKKDKLLVLYLGRNEKVLQALEAQLGRQFAGE
jgi:hypothetical protein